MLNLKLPLVLALMGTCNLKAMEEYFSGSSSYGGSSSSSFNPMSASAETLLTDTHSESPNPKQTDKLQIATEQCKQCNIPISGHDQRGRMMRMRHIPVEIRETAKQYCRECRPYFMEAHSMSFEEYKMVRSFQKSMEKIIYNILPMENSLVVQHIRGIDNDARRLGLVQKLALALDFFRGKVDEWASPKGRLIPKDLSNITSIIDLKSLFQVLMGKLHLAMIKTIQIEGKAQEFFIEILDDVVLYMTIFRQLVSWEQKNSYDTLIPALTNTQGLGQYQQILEKLGDRGQNPTTLDTAQRAARILAQIIPNYAEQPEIQASVGSFRLKISPESGEAANSEQSSLDESGLRSVKEYHNMHDPHINNKVETWPEAQQRLNRHFNRLSEEAIMLNQTPTSDLKWFIGTAIMHCIQTAPAYEGEFELQIRKLEELLQG